MSGDHMMKKALIFCILVVCVGCLEDRTSPQDMQPVVRLQKIGEGAFPKWCAANNMITFTREVNDLFEVFVMNHDGTDVECLTCGKEALSECGNRGQSFWHPSGKYIVFTAENAHYPRKGIGTVARPGIGRNFNVWIMTADGEPFWQITDNVENWGVIEARFSHDGTMIYWCEEYSMEKYPQGKPGDPVPHPGSFWGGENLTYRKGEEAGAWRVVYADITFDDGPYISNLNTVAPPDGFTLIEGTGFTPDDTGFIYCYDDLSETGGIGLWGDIYISDLQGNALTNLTRTPSLHDEDAEFSPDGTRIIFKEQLHHWDTPPGKDTEIFIMNSDGTGKHRLTYLTDPESSHFIAGASHITEMDWSPDGTKIIFGLAYDGGPGILTGGPHLQSDLFMLIFENSDTIQWITKERDRATHNNEINRQSYP
jgi:Tol biopolymer transport system component